MSTQASVAHDQVGVTAPDTPSRPRVSVRNLTKTYRTKNGQVTALNDVSLEVAEGEIMVLLGPSGCGKTTLLRSVAGLEQPDAGEITIHGDTVFSSERGISLSPERRRLSMVFQSYALWPHMTVARNIAYPLKATKLPKQEVQQQVEQVLETVGLEKFAGNYPGQLSGGQQQRVALARALVANQGVILFDEPLSNLDAKVRERLRDELLSLHEEIGFTALYVTHDQTEATGLAGRIAVMQVGEVAQLGTPLDVYLEPSSRYVADFVGSANEVRGTVAGSDGRRLRVTTAAGDLWCGPCGAAPAVGTEVDVMFRPEHVKLVPVLGTEGNDLEAEVAQSVFLGSHYEHKVVAGEQDLVLRTMDGGTLERGTRVVVHVDADQARAFVRGEAPEAR